MSDQWTWYKLALAGKAPPLSDDGTVRSGFYFTKASRNGGRIPVAIWTKDDAFNCRFGDKANRRDLTLRECLDRWPFIHNNPVTRDDYVAAYEHGAWPDGTPTMAPISDGSNLPTDPFERLKAELDDKMASARDWLKTHVSAANQTEADRATNLHRELTALIKQADAMHKAEKAPILAAADAVETKFKFRAVAKGIGDHLKSIYNAFAVAEEARLKAEAQKKYEAERKAAEAARREIEAAREKKMRDDPIAALTDPEPELPMAPAAPAIVKVQTGGGIGRAAGLKSVWIGEITDYQACLAHFSEMPEVRDAVQKLVNAHVRAAKSAAKIPGVVVKEERRVA